MQKLHSRAAHIIASVPNDVEQQTVLNIWETLKIYRMKAKAKIIFKMLLNIRANYLRIIHFQKGNIKPQSS
jgi:hypothetical protein